MREPPKREPPEWAASYVRGAVRLGMSVPEIEDHLVSKGMVREEANRLILDTMYGPIPEESASGRFGDWAKPIRLCASAAIAGACVLLAYSPFVAFFGLCHPPEVLNNADCLIDGRS